MKRQFFNYIVFVLLAGFSLQVNAQGIKAEAKLQDYTIKIGDQTRLFLIVTKATNEQVNFPKLLDTVTGKIQIVSVNKADTVIDQKDKNLVTITQSYTITSFDEGAYTIPSFAFGAAGGIVKSNELTLQVQTVKVDTTKAIYDIKQPLVVSYTFFDWLRDNWILILAALAGIALLAWAIYYWKVQSKNKFIIKDTTPPLPEHTIAINKLKTLRDKKLWQQEQVKEYYSELTDIIREYLEKRYDIKTYEKTTDEIIASLKQRDLTEANNGLVKQILVLADLVKFAKEKPLPTENERILDDALEFVLKTKLEATPNQNTDGGSANELA